MGGNALGVVLRGIYSHKGGNKTDFVHDSLLGVWVACVLILINQRAYSMSFHLVVHPTIVPYRDAQHPVPSFVWVVVGILR